ncbi:hypothetical protein V5F40_06690 [Xanthobacter sp. DSM 14520]|uniref:DUF7697 family protein n=1 Tax=Xanthobacter autotrophicus (strain ATCC BAA-1158 / Py2) TaxID=78245 RepID=UPI00372AB01B
MVGSVVVGLDLGALLALGAGLGACPMTLSEVLVDLEAPIVATINERLRSGEDG